MLSRIDYCNALVGLPASSLAPLQRVINAAARFVANLRPRDHVSHVLRDLHWLPIRERISYKVCLMMFNIVSGTAPTYMTGSRAFPIIQVGVISVLPQRDCLTCLALGLCLVPGLFQSLAQWPGTVSLYVRVIRDVIPFKSALKTHFFQIAYPT